MANLLEKCKDANFLTEVVPLAFASGTTTSFYIYYENISATQKVLCNVHHRK